MTPIAAKSQPLRALAATPPRDNAAPIRRIFLLVAPTLAAAGPLLSLGGPVYAFRVVAIAFWVHSFVGYSSRGRRAFTRSKFMRSVRRAGIAWLSAGLVLALVVATDHRAAASELTSVAVGMLFVSAVLRVGRPATTLKTLQLGWVLAFVATGVIGTMEIVTGTHASNYLVGQVAWARNEGLIAATFGNPNAYAVFLASGTPIVLSLLARRVSVHMRALLILLSLWWAVLLVATGGRLALAGALVAVTVWLVKVERRRAGLAIAAAGTAVALTLLAGAGSAVSAALPQKLGGNALSELFKGDPAQLQSGSTRVDLTVDGLRMVYRTVGLGVGPANFAAQEARHHQLDPTSRNFSPHNATVELLAQYGVVVFVLVLLAAITPVRWSLKITPRDDEQRRAQAYVLGAAFGFLLFSLSSSTFWADPTTWVIVATYLAAARAIEDTLRRSVPAAEYGVHHAALPATAAR